MIFKNYLLDKRGNKGLRDKKETIISEVISELNDSSTDLEDAAAEIVIQLRKRGIKIPLKITLLIKNLNGLKRLAQRTGFSSLKDALEFTPKKAVSGIAGDTGKAGSAERLLNERQALEHLNAAA